MKQVAAEKTKVGREGQAARQGKLPAKNPANPKAPVPTPQRWDVHLKRC